jgi:hypothetical protein
MEERDGVPRQQVEQVTPDQAVWLKANWSQAGGMTNNIPPAAFPEIQ